MKFHHHTTHGSDYNVICDRCGLTFKASQCRKEWTGLFVCTSAGNNCWEERHPQEFIRPVIDRQNVPIARPDTVPIEMWTPATSQLAISGTFIAGDGYPES